MLLSATTPETFSLLKQTFVCFPLALTQLTSFDHQHSIKLSSFLTGMYRFIIKAFIALFQLFHHVLKLFTLAALSHSQEN